MIVATFLIRGGHLTRARALSDLQAVDEGTLREVLPLACIFEPQEEGGLVRYYRALDKRHRQIGVVFKAEAKGYSGAIDTLVGMLDDGTITAIKVVNQEETSGLGARVCEPDFAGRFAHKKIDELGEVQAITGATVSSHAVIASVKAKAQEMKALLKNEK